MNNYGPFPQYCMAIMMYDDLFDDLFGVLHACVQQRRPLTYIVPRVIEATEARIAKRYGAVLARRTRFVHGVLLQECTKLLGQPTPVGLRVVVTSKTDKKFIVDARKILRTVSPNNERRYVSTLNEIYTNYLTSVTDLPLRACIDAYDMMDVGMHFNLILIDLQKNRTRFEDVFEPGHDGERLRELLKGGDGCGHQH